MFFVAQSSCLVRGVDDRVEDSREACESVLRGVKTRGFFGGSLVSFFHDDDNDSDGDSDSLTIVRLAR